MKGGGEMRYLLNFFVLLSLVIANGVISKAADDTDSGAGEPTSAPVASAEAQPVYPIAPGVWYPGDPLPEKPMRYYRVRCFPGCHRGSSYGKYPDEPLKVDPIFPTSTIDRCPSATTGAK